MNIKNIWIQSDPLSTHLSVYIFYGQRVEAQSDSLSVYISPNIPHHHHSHLSIIPHQMSNTNLTN